MWCRFFLLSSDNLQTATFQQVDNSPRLFFLFFSCCEQAQSTSMSSSSSWLVKWWAPRQWSQYQAMLCRMVLLVLACFCLSLLIISVFLAWFCWPIQQYSLLRSDLSHCYLLMQVFALSVLSVPWQSEKDSKEEILKAFRLFDEDETVSIACPPFIYAWWFQFLLDDFSVWNIQILKHDHHDHHWTRYMNMYCCCVYRYMK